MSRLSRLRSIIRQDYLVAKISLIVQLPSNQLVSWRSSYWALFGLALNTFIQSPGTVLAFPEQSGRCLRTSPIICIVDTALILFQYLALRRLGRNHVDTSRLIIRKRFLENEFQTTRTFPYVIATPPISPPPRLFTSNATTAISPQPTVQSRSYFHI